MDGHLGNYSDGYVPFLVLGVSFFHVIETHSQFKWVNTWTYTCISTKDARGSLNQLFERELTLLVKRGYEFFSVIEYNLIPSEREIPKIHRILQKMGIPTMKSPKSSDVHQLQFKRLRG